MSPDWTPELAAEGRRLRDWLVELMGRGVESPLSEAEFNGLALEVFRFQVKAVPVYGAFAQNRGVEPASLERWEEIPPVPARAFRELALVAGDPDAAEAVFRTSGTTGGEERRGVHRVRDLSLYRASLVPNARAHLNPTGEELEVVALLPAPRERPESSLVHMAGVLVEAWSRGPGPDSFLADGEWRLEMERLSGTLDRLAAGSTPVLVLGTAFAFVHLLDRARQEALEWSLPPGSRVMETGGFKGRSREVSREELYRGIHNVLDVTPHRIVNEYGMTELLSQFYEPLLERRTPAPPAQRHLVGPPWVRTRILDPDRLTPVEGGTPGLLQHLDLANLYSVSAVLTEDVGRRRGDGFRVQGRSPDAEPRGCSLTMEELLVARREEGEAGDG